MSKSTLSKQKSFEDRSLQISCGAIKKKSVGIYKGVISSKPFSFSTPSEVYNFIKSDQDLANKTRIIQERHKEGILENFQSIDKGAYQKDKRQLLDLAVIFAGCFDRSKGAKNKEVQHSGLINIDVDEDTPEQLKEFFHTIKKGQVPYIEAAARSVSGALTGALWLNVRVEIPSKLSSIPSYIVRKLALTKENYQEGLHVAFYEMFAYMLKERYQITAGKSKDLKRLRYMTSDSEIYINEEAKRLKLGTLESFLKQKEEEQVSSFERSTINIKETDAFKFARKFTQQEYSLQSGQKHLFLTRFSIACNLLGVPQAETEAHVTNILGVNVTTNCISFPYQNYKESFGHWKHKLTPSEVEADYSLTLKKGEKLSIHCDKILDIYKQEAACNDVVKLDIKSGTGSGKSYLFAKLLGSRLKELNNNKTIIVFPLNVKTEKDANQYNLPYLTGESLKNSRKETLVRTIQEEDVILTNQHTLPIILGQLAKSGIKANIVLDESQSLVGGMSFKAEVLNKLWDSSKCYAKTLTLLSGTPKPYFKKIGFKRLDVIQEERPKIKVTIKKARSKKELTALELIENFNFEKKKLVIKLQSKVKIWNVKKLLIQKGWSPEEIFCLYSDKKVKDSARYKRFIEHKTESFDDSTKVVLCTSFINEGIDVYSDDFELVFATIEDYKFDIDSFVQFCDRWRTKKDKEVILFTSAQTKEELDFLIQDYSKKLDIANEQRREKLEDKLEKLTNIRRSLTFEFNPIFEYNQLLARWERQAQRLTEDLLDLAGYCTDLEKKTFKTQFDDNKKYLQVDEEARLVCVNYLALMSEVEKERLSKTGIDQALKEIERCFSYFEFNDLRNAISDDLSEDDKLQLQKIKANNKDAKKQAQSALKAIFEGADKDLLFETVAFFTEDTKLKKKIPFDKDDKKTFEVFAKKHTDAFDDHFKEAERLVKTSLSFSKRGFDDNDFKKIFFEDDSFISFEKLANFKEAFSIHSRLENKTKLSFLEAEDHKAIKTIKESLSKAIKQHKSKKLESTQILEAIKPFFNSNMTQRKAARLAKILFKTSRSNGSYLFHGQRTLQDVLQDFDLDVNKLQKQVNNRFKTVK